MQNFYLNLIFYIDTDILNGFKYNIFRHNTGGENI